ncbi:hypothetical protein MMMDOFMJ_2824 [Methylobacterium gnaphalii]|nr:hypothetical protein MMMDOFMJ_2824 [Methylobacterium gnaphalii]
MPRKHNHLATGILADALQQVGIGAAVVDREALRLAWSCPSTTDSSRTKRSPLVITEARIPTFSRVHETCTAIQNKRGRRGP